MSNRSFVWWLGDERQRGKQGPVRDTLAVTCRNLPRETEQLLEAVVMQEPKPREHLSLGVRQLESVADWTALGGDRQPSKQTWQSRAWSHLLPERSLVQGYLSSLQPTDVVLPLGEHL